jgi:hypothetical protein
VEVRRVEQAGRRPRRHRGVPPVNRPCPDSGSVPTPRLRTAP